MCKYCDYDSDECQIFQDWPEGLWYLDIETGEWDNYDDDYIRERVYIEWCPFCGRDLYHHRSCSTCKYSCTPYENKSLYQCLNTEILIKSSLTEKFHCSKWEEKEGDD